MLDRQSCHKSAGCASKRALHTPLLLAVVVSLSTLLLYLQSPAIAATPAGEPPQTIAELRAAIDSLLQKHKIPGAAIALVHRDSLIWAGGVGKADVAAGIDVTAQTFFRAGSISKTFVALALVRLQEAGRLDLKMPLREIAPEVPFDNPWRESHPLRVIHLLEHTAGFDDMHFNEMYNIKDAADIPLHQVLALNLRSKKSRWPPGTRMAYSNPGYGVAGYLVEKLSGELLDPHLRRAVFAPLDMPYSSFEYTDTVQARLAQGYDDPEQIPLPYRHIYLRPAGSLHTSAQELAQLVRALLNRGQTASGRLIQEASLAQMERPQTTLAAQRGLANGYGTGIYTALGQKIKLYGHDGGIDGFLSSYGYSPEVGLGYVTLVNSTVSGRGAQAIRDTVIAYLLRSIEGPERPAAPLQPAEIAPYLGYYSPSALRNQLFAFAELFLSAKSVFVTNDTLYYKELFGEKVALIPCGDNQFRTRKQAEPSMIFITLEDGTRVLAGGFFGYYEQRPDWLPWLYRGAIFTALGLMLSSLLYALVWMPMKLLGKLRGSQLIAARLLPLLSVVSLVTAMIAFLQLDIIESGTFNLPGFAYAALSVLFALFAFWGLWAAVRGLGRRGGVLVKIHSLLVALACSGMAGYLGYWNMIGMRTWTW